MIAAMIDLLQQQAPPGGGLLAFAPLLFIFVIFYFLVFAPMRKKQRQTQQMLSRLKKGDEVVTTGGIFGRIAAIDEERGFLVLQIADNVKVKIQRSGIAGLVGESAAAATTPAKG
jgi:preprotein translocase subunit YajC